MGRKSDTPFFVWFMHLARFAPERRTRFPPRARALDPASTTTLPPGDALSPSPPRTSTLPPAPSELAAPPDDTPLRPPRSSTEPAAPLASPDRTTTAPLWATTLPPPPPPPPLNLFRYLLSSIFVGNCFFQGRLQKKCININQIDNQTFH